MPSVSEFLIERMHNAGINHVFGVPGDYVLNFYNKLSKEPNITLVNAADESGAGFAADAYARIHGIGCVCVTYNVGALKIANSVACAYAERSPLVVISGSPGVKERKEGVLLHHMVRSFECQKQIFDNITCASIVLDNPNTAGYDIDRVFEILKHKKQPIYIELPRDIADKPISYDVYKLGTPDAPKTDDQNLTEAIDEIESWLAKSNKPVILAGVELSRFGLGSELIKFAEKYNIPVATTLLSKSVVNEQHPLYLGVYGGNASQIGVQHAVESSDCLLMFGVMLTDMTLSFMPSKFKKRNVVSASVENLEIKSHTYKNVQFLDFMKSFFKIKIAKKENRFESLISRDVEPFEPVDVRLKTARFFEKINSIIDKNMVVIADIGDSLFGASDFTMCHENSFLAAAFYTSMGTAIPGALGVQMANPQLRPIVIVGDGAFQMSALELGTIVKNKLNPIVFVLNNKGYTTERFLLDGSFNDIPNWNYGKITELIGGGKAYVVENEISLDKAVTESLKNKELSVVNVIVDKFDVSPALKRLTEGLAKKV